MGHDSLIYVTKLLGTANEVVQKRPLPKESNALLKIRGQKKELGEREKSMKHHGFSILIQIPSSTTRKYKPIDWKPQTQALEERTLYLDADRTLMPRIKIRYRRTFAKYSVHPERE